VDNDFKQEMGFSKVIEILIECKKPMAGHNMIFDLAYLLNQFVEDLPLTYI
jgi:poly(A)-specific ribonuclease